jgi:branched-chain amino acid aminotransferase
MSKGKISGQYVTGVLAKRDAIARGFDEALMLDTEGYMAEGTGENLFIVKEGIVKTTPLTSILNGITRNTTVRILKQQGIPVQEARFTRDELITADEIFLTGTAAEVTPVASIDGMPIGYGTAAGKPGPISLNLAKDYQRLVRGEWKFENSAEWLTAIR